jgi:hypothetical protein
MHIKHVFRALACPNPYLPLSDTVNCREQAWLLKNSFRRVSTTETRLQVIDCPFAAGAEIR